MINRKPTFSDLIGNPYRQHPRYWGCVGHWIMAEGGGTRVHDISGFGNDGTMTNMVPASDWVTGQFGRALDFDGANDYVSIPDDPSLRLTGMVTIGAWIKWRSTSGFDVVIGQASGGGNLRNFVFLKDSAGDKFNVWLYVGDADNLASQTLTQLGWSTNEWHHVAVVVDDVANTYEFFFDGVSDGQQTLVGDFNGSFAGPTWIGDSTFIQPWDGLIDEVRVYNRALTPNEVLSLYVDPFLEFRRERRIWRVPAAVGADVRRHIIPAYMRIA